jgi:hypothetical protein
MSHQKWLWEAQIVFLSKQGKNVLNYLLRMKENNPLLQAKIWVKLARSSVDSKEIDSSYKKASDILEGNVECSEILIEWSTWLHSRGEDVVGKLKLAAEILTGIEKEAEEDNKSQSSSNSRLSKSSGRSSSKKSAVSKSAASKTKSKIMSKDEVDGNPDKLNVTHFDRLIRIYMMLGELAPNANRRKQYSLIAFSYVLRILELTLGSFSREKQDWLEFKIPDEIFAELEKLEEREKLCKFAFDKIEVSHSMLRTLAEWLDEVFMQQWECLVLLEYLKSFARLVLKSHAYEWIYASWKHRVYKKIGIEKDFNIPFPRFSPEESLHMAEELFKRDEIIESEKIFKTLKPSFYLGKIFMLQGKNKQAIRTFQLLLEEKTLENLKFSAEIANFLMISGKFQDGYSLLQQVIEKLSTCKSNNSLTTTWVLTSCHLGLASLSAVQASSPINTLDEKSRFKSQLQESLKFFLQTAKMKGCSASHIYQYLSIHDFLSRKIENKLVSGINRNVMTKRLERLGRLRNFLTVCSSLCVDLLDIDLFGEGQAISGLIDWKIGEVTMMAEVMRKELVKRSSYDNVITKYLDEMDLLVQEENRKQSKNDSVGEIIDEGIESVLKYLENALVKVRPTVPIYPMIQNSMCFAKYLNHEEFSMPEQVFSLRFPFALYKYFLLALQVKGEGGEGFANLAFLQHSRCREHLLSLFLQKGKPWLKDRLLLSLLYPASVQSSLCHQPNNETFLSSSNVFKNLSWKPNFDDMKEHCQANSAVLILQFSVDIADIYAGLMILDKEKNPRYWVNVKKISSEDQKELIALQEKFRVFKGFTLKDPISDEEDQDRHWAEAERKLEEINVKMRSLFSWLDVLHEQLNPESPVEVLEEHPAKKKQAAPAKGKAEDKAADSGLPVPSSGVATLYLCVDSRFIELPWEILTPVALVPIIVRDFSMVSLDYRLSHSSNFTKDTLKYIIEKPAEPKASELSDKLCNELNTAKFDGNRVTSAGQWEKICSSAGLLVNVQNSGIDLQICSSLSSVNSCKALLVLDSFNTLKRYMKKTVPAESGIVEMMSLLGCNSIIHNTWSLPPALACEGVSHIWKYLSTGQSLGGAVYKWKQGLRPVFALSIQQYGLPFLRIA